VFRGRMLKRWIGMGFFVGTLVAGAQGTVQFTTLVKDRVEAQVRDPWGTPASGPKFGEAWFAGQLLGGPVGGPMVSLGAAVPFRSDVWQGYITEGGTVAIPGSTPGGEAQVRLMAWYAEMGVTRKPS